MRAGAPGVASPGAPASGALRSPGVPGYLVGMDELKQLKVKITRLNKEALDVECAMTGRTLGGVIEEALDLYFDGTAPQFRSVYATKHAER